MSEYFVWGINPEPWRVPGFTHAGKHIVPVKDGKCEAYQEALAEEIVSQNPGLKIHTGLLAVEFFVWRSTGHGMPADVTNIQKATEDALQGVLYENDKDNRLVTTVLCEQSPETYPAIMVRVSRFQPRVIPVLPERPEIEKFSDSEWQPPEIEMF